MNPPPTRRSRQRLGNQRITWDRHYHVTLLSDSHLRSLLTELDLDRDMKWSKPNRLLHGRQAVLDVQLTRVPEVPPLSLIDKFRLGATIFYASKVKIGSASRKSRSRIG